LLLATALRLASAFEGFLSVQPSKAVDSHVLRLQHA